jgi:hypothetical protein
VLRHSAVRNAWRPPQDPATASRACGKAGLIYAQTRERGVNLPHLWSCFSAETPSRHPLVAFFCRNLLQTPFSRAFLQKPPTPSRRPLIAFLCRNPPPGSSWGPWGTILGTLGTILGTLGDDPGGRPWGPWGPWGAILGTLRTILGTLGAILGTLGWGTTPGDHGDPGDSLHPFHTHTHLHTHTPPHTYTSTHISTYTPPHTHLHTHTHAYITSVPQRRKCGTLARTCMHALACPAGTHGAHCARETPGDVPPGAPGVPRMASGRRKFRMHYGATSHTQAHTTYTSTHTLAHRDTETHTHPQIRRSREQNNGSKTTFGGERLCVPQLVVLPRVRMSADICRRRGAVRRPGGPERAARAGF